MKDLVVGISDFQCSNKPEDILVTYALGSCIAVVVYDPVAVVGGLLHLMLPDSTLDQKKAAEVPAMFADTGIPLLFKSCYRLGAEKKRMKVKLVGGASILNDANYFRIGQKNITATRKIFWKNNVLIDAEDTGLNCNRTVRLQIADGKCYIKTSRGGHKGIVMIDKILLSVNKLPAFPMTIQRVIELLRDEDYSVAEVANVIKYDQAIAANILKISNSAYFGSRQKIKTISDAVIHLGQKQLVRAVQTAGVSRFFTQNTKGYGTKAKELWEHSVAVALMSQILSRQFYRQDDGALYTAALLHDIGKLVMGEYVQESSESILQLVSEKGLSFLEAEEEIIGINHATLGGRIAEYWNFPREIRNAIAYHHRPDQLDREETDAMPSLVYLADQYCLMMGIDGGMDGLAHRGVSDVLKKFHLRAVDLEKGWVKLLEELEQARDLMQIV